MKVSSLVVPCLLGFALLASAQDDAEFVKWMKTTGGATKVLRESKTGAEAASSAEKVAAVYDQMKGFWAKRNASDAVKLSEEGHRAATELAAAAKAGDDQKAAAAFKALGATCKPCHDAHREKLEDGSYRIK